MAQQVAQELVQVRHASTTKKLVTGRIVRLDGYLPPNGQEPWAVIVFGHGTGLHGSPAGDGLSYAPFLSGELARRGIAAIAFTLPDHGFSDNGKRRGDWRFRDYVLCSLVALEWIKELGWGELPCVFMGWSQGGLGGTLVAAHLKNTFDGYILHNAGRGQDPEMRQFSLYCSDNPFLDWLWRIPYWFQRLVLLGIVARIVPGLRLPTSLYLPLMEIFEEDKEAVRAWFEDKLAVRWYTLGAVRSLVCTEVGDLSEVTVPVMVLQPVNDISPQGYEQEVADLFGNGFLQVIPGAGHSMIRKQPARLADLVERFLKEDVLLQPH